MRFQHLLSYQEDARGNMEVKITSIWWSMKTDGSRSGSAGELPRVHHWQIITTEQQKPLLQI